jgi:hypothetical protein
MRFIQALKSANEDLLGKESVLAQLGRAGEILDFAVEAARVFAEVRSIALV